MAIDGQLNKPAAYTRKTRDMTAAEADAVASNTEKNWKPAPKASPPAQNALEPGLVPGKSPAKKPGIAPKKAVTAEDIRINNFVAQAAKAPDQPSAQVEQLAAPQQATGAVTSGKLSSTAKISLSKPGTKPPAKDPVNEAMRLRLRDEIDTRNHPQKVEQARTTALNSRLQTAQANFDAQLESEFFRSQQTGDTRRLQQLKTDHTLTQEYYHQQHKGEIPAYLTRDEYVDFVGRYRQNARRYWNEAQALYDNGIPNSLITAEDREGFVSSTVNRRLRNDNDEYVYQQYVQANLLDPTKVSLTEFKQQQRLAREQQQAEDAARRAYESQRRFEQASWNLQDFKLPTDGSPIPWRPARTEEEAIMMGQVLGIDYVNARHVKPTLQQMNDFNQAVANMPGHVIKTLLDNNTGLYGYPGQRVDDHPNFRTEKIRGNNIGYSGYFDRKAITTLAPGYQWVALHENAHTYAALTGFPDLTEEWAALTDRYLKYWEGTHHETPVESFAQASTLYFLSPQARNSLPQPVRTFLEKVYSPEYLQSLNSAQL